MIQLIGYEWKKILMKKVNVVVLVAGILLMIAYVSYSIYDNSVISTDTKEYVTGIKSFVLSKEQNQELTESLTEDFLSKEVGRIQSYVKRDNISYNISLPVRRAVFLQVLKKPYFVGFPAHFPFLSFGNKARIFAGTFKS